MWLRSFVLLAGLAPALAPASALPGAPQGPAPLARALAPADPVSALQAAAPDANPEVIRQALTALQCATGSGMAPSRRLAVIDYSLPSSTPRLWVFDLESQRLLFRELVAHGRNTGDRMATRFSNELDSRTSSIGLFRTGDTYQGSNGYSMRMQGLEPGFNDRAEERAIVMHGAPYVTDEHVRRFGRIGRSWGCPAVRLGVAKQIIDTLKGGQFVFSYYPDNQWLTASRYLNCGNRQTASR